MGLDQLGLLPAVPGHYVGVGTEQRLFPLGSLEAAPMLWRERVVSRAGMGHSGLAGFGVREKFWVCLIFCKVVVVL